MAPEGCLHSAAVWRPSGDAVSRGSQIIQRSYSGHNYLLPLPKLQKTSWHKCRPGLKVESARRNEEWDEKPGDAKEASDAWLAKYGNVKHGMWKPMVEPMNFAGGKPFCDDRLLKKKTVRRSEGELMAQLGLGGKRVTTDPKLVRMLDYKLTSGDHKGKRLREVSKKYLEWLATSTASLKALQRGDLGKVILRTKEEVTDVSEMAAIVLQLPEIKDTVRQVDLDEMQDSGYRAQGSTDVYKAALLKMKSMDIELELKKKAREEEKQAARLAVEGGRVGNSLEARRLKRRVKQWDEESQQKREGLADTIEHNLQKMESDAEEALKSNYGVVSSGDSLQPAQLPSFPGRDKMLNIAQKALVESKLLSSQPLELDADVVRPVRRRSPSAGTRQKRTPRKVVGESASQEDWRKASKREPSS